MKQKRKILSTMVTASELADIWQVEPSTISRMKDSGLVHPDEHGFYNMAAETASYIHRLIDRRESDVDAETAYWKLQNIKQKNRDVRMERDRMICVEVLSQLATAMQDLKARLSGGLDASEAIDEMIGAIGSVDVDSVSLAVEGENDEDEG